MQRNMDLIREILMTIADDPSGWAPDNLKIEGYSDEQVGYHALLLIEAGLAEGVDVTPAGSDSSPKGMITRLTWPGHEFLDNIRPDSVWKKTKSLLKEKGIGLSFDAITVAIKSVVSSML